jgi:hypothetical protein
MIPKSPHNIVAYTYIVILNGILFATDGIGIN